MATSLQTIRRMTIESRSVGVDETTQKMLKLGQAQDSVSASSETASKQSGAYERALESQRRALEMTTRLNAEMARDRAALSAQLMQQAQAANDNNRSVSANGLEWAEWANHIKTAGSAAYAFSPAFRGVVNELSAPVLRASLTATTVAVTGAVAATNLAGKGLIELGLAATRVSPALAPVGGQIAIAGAAMAAFNPSIAAVAGSILSRLLPALRLLGTIGIVVNVAQMIGEAWRLGGEKLAEYVAIAERAARSGVSTDFFQRIGKAAEAARLPVDDLTAALKKLNDSFAPKLGGNDAMNRLDALTKAGNFQGNSGVAAVKSANDPEERFNAVVKLIREAMDAGQRLAALDVSRSFLGDAVTANLAKDSEYLDKMKATIENTKAAELVSAADIGRATDLQNRLDAAEKILSQRWHPIQDLLTQGGIAMRGIWVDIVETIARGVDWIGKMIEKLQGVPTWFATGLRYLAGAAAAVGPALGPVGAVLGIGGRMAGAALAPADVSNPTGDAMRNPANINRARDYANNVLNNVRPDTSKDPDAKKGPNQVADAYDRAEESLLKYIEVTLAAAVSTGQGVEQQERLRAVAQLTAAGLKDRLTPAAAKARAEMSGLAEKAGQAALVLEKARIASDIKFNRDTAFLSQEDVQIAQQLRKIYPEVADALGSVEAQGIRANNVFREISTTASTALTGGLTDILDGTKSVSQGFADMSKAILRALEEAIIKMMIVAPIMRALQSSFGGLLGGGAFGAQQAPDSAFPKPFANGGYTGSGGKYQPAGIVHAGEYVFSQASVSRLGVGNLDRLHRGYADGGFVSPPVSRLPYGQDNSPKFTVNVIEDSSRAGQRDESQNSSGGTDLSVFVDAITAKNATKPGSATSRALDGRKRLATR